MTRKLTDRIIGMMEDVRSRKPLVHHITNYVTVNDCANIVLAIGASPIMADDIDEVETITSISSALVINIGTLNRRTIESMVAAGKKANELGIPVVLDPVGAGASSLRNQTTQRILDQVKITVLRGNMSEIRFTAGLEADTKGVEVSEADQNIGADEGSKVAQDVARKFGCVVAITGPTDIITDGDRTIYIENGTKHMSNITGTGCMCSSLVGAFCGVLDGKSDGPLVAAAGGVLVTGLSGEIAYEATKHLGYGSFRTGIIDTVSKLDADTLIEKARIYGS
ncbi:MAG TPA: hydroxyethylthiazole kinase [Firmicutes bacterium]|jgi:hydroxyethylthiazole kinase|nr:hydroxyethylthiazole kinase [Bacillota bacterium]